MPAKKPTKQTKKKTVRKSTAKKVTKKKTAKPVKRASQPKVKKSRKKVVAKSTVEPIENKVPISVEEAKPAEAADLSGREQLDRLIAQESVSDHVIFSSRIKEEETDVVPEEQVPVQNIENIEQEYEEFDDTVYMSHGEPVSFYRKFLLWSSVGLCAGVIGFGWFLTIGGSLGLKDTNLDTEGPAAMINEFNDEIKKDLEGFQEQAEVQKDKTYIEDETLENLVEGIKSATTTDEVEVSEGRDIFVPPSGTEEVVE